jgi:hypothetical protein
MRDFKINFQKKKLKPRRGSGKTWTLPVFLVL